MNRSVLQSFIYISKRFAGHSKWANIKHIKGAKDAARSALFTKLSRQLKVAVAEGGSTDPNKNIKLSQLLDQCRRFNMPAATQQSIIKSCEGDKTKCQSVTLDIKGPGSCFILAELYTTNISHSKQIIATMLKKHNSKFADGSGMHLFEEKGNIYCENSNLAGKSDEAQIDLATEHAIESNAEEVELVEENIFHFVCTPETFMQTQKSLEALGYTILDSSVDYTPTQVQRLSPTDLELCEKLTEKLEQVPEIVRVFDNASSS